MMGLLGRECRQQREGLTAHLLSPGALKSSVVRMKRNQQRRMEECKQGGQKLQVWYPGNQRERFKEEAMPKPAKVRKAGS